MGKRLVALFAFALMGFTFLLCNLSLLSTNTVYAAAAAQQSRYYLPLADGRGNIFDCNFMLLTGAQKTYYGLVAPGDESYHTMFDAVLPENRATLYSEAQKHKPFLVQLTPEKKNEVNYAFESCNRYFALPIAPHLIGYRNGEGIGVSGIEYAFDALLAQGSTKKQVFCVTNARGAIIDEEEPRVLAAQGTGEGVMLTIDEKLQRLCEAVAYEMMDKGSIVVLDSVSGRVKASVSMPVFDPENVAQSLEDADSSLLNRSIQNFNVGSVFKPLLAAAALENGIDPEEIYTCTGSTEVNGHVYRCANGKAHEEVNLKQALEISCNCYFIQLGLRLGGEIVHTYAANAGFGTRTIIGGTLQTAKGNLPSAEALQDVGQLASVSFGQGTLLASPVQVAACINMFANGGVYIAPTFVEGIVNEYTHTVTQSLYSPVQRQCLRPETAQSVRDMMVSVVENGLGKSAKPVTGGAGGKTGTAQTGRFTQDGEEIMDAWFTGFYPAQNPQYTIVVMLDSGTHTGEDACRIFERVASALSFFVAAQ